MTSLLLTLLSLAASAGAQQALEVRRGDLPIVVRVHGTVVASELVRLRSTIAGRVEEVFVSSGAWAPKDLILGRLVGRELAAMLDSRTPATRQQTLEERWGGTYKPADISCPGECFVLRSFVKPKQWVKPQAVLFEVARKLSMVGRVRPEDAHWIRDGQALEFWSVEDPATKMRATVSRYLLDVQGQRVEPGGSFTMEMDPGRFLQPGTEWEGTIVPLTKRGILLVPTQALLEHEGAAYLPVRVSTGITTEELTEITAGVEERRSILVPGEAQLEEAGRHKVGVDSAALEKRRKEQAGRQKPPPGAPPKPSPSEPANPLPEIGVDYGGDPYAP